ncbi:MAG: hypothetical protein HY903_25010 [Deltaproteobacteria bacterium]|nr:hypothetical protein [Deltaproteobacteria bacterium]
MGEKLMKYYKFVDEKGGMQAKMRLAMRTAMPSHLAKDAPDSPENLQKFFDAAREILGADVPKL